MQSLLDRGHLVGRYDFCTPSARQLTMLATSDFPVWYLEQVPERGDEVAHHIGDENNNAEITEREFFIRDDFNGVGVKRDNPDSENRAWREDAQNVVKAKLLHDPLKSPDPHLTRKPAGVIAVGPFALNDSILLVNDHLGIS